MPILKLRKFLFSQVNLSNIVSTSSKIHNPPDKYYLQIRSMMSWPTRLPKGILKSFVSVYYKTKGLRCYITSDALNFVVNIVVIQYIVFTTKFNASDVTWFSNLRPFLKFLSHCLKKNSSNSKIQWVRTVLK